MGWILSFWGFGVGTGKRFDGVGGGGILYIYVCLVVLRGGDLVFIRVEDFFWVGTLVYIILGS